MLIVPGTRGSSRDRDTIITMTVMMISMIVIISYFTNAQRFKQNVF